MDWIDPRQAKNLDEFSTAGTQTARGGRRGKRQSKRLHSQVDAALAQPLSVWSSAFDHALAALKWPQACSAESTFLWSSVMQEQAEVLVRAGMSGKKLSAILAESEPSDDQHRAEQMAEVVGLMDQSLESLAFEWLDEVDDYAHAALGVAALAWHIPEHARRPVGDWLPQWFQSVVDRITRQSSEHAESVLCDLVLRCELPLLTCLATAASKRTVLAESSQAMDNLAELLERADDEPGPWLAYGATYLRAALGSVLRCRVLADGLGLRKWFPAQQRSLAKLLIEAARWSRCDGTQLLGAGRTSPRAKSLWQALAKQTRKPKTMVTAMTLAGLLPGKRSDFNHSPTAAKMPPPTVYNAYASCAVMQSSWKQRGGRLAVDFSETNICLEALGPKGCPLVVGEWTTHVELDGQAQLQLAEWEELCWFSDEDVDYIEVEARFGQDARVQRQAILFRSERLLLLADALLCERDGAWSLDSHIPLAADASYHPEAKTQEGFIRTGKGASCIVLPLFLPEWRRQLASGSLTCDEHGNLVAHHETQGERRLYSPLLISLSGRHAKSPYTWRRLTVGEDLRVVRPDEAVAYRVQLGNEQTLLYRTLAQANRRTTLGMHTMADFYAGRIVAEDGEIDPLVEVEAS